jgi:hypothetical protein
MGWRHGLSGPPAHTARLDSALASRYRIERKLGEGGMATAYLAEIKTTANLQHPHILPLFEVGSPPGRRLGFGYKAFSGDRAAVGAVRIMYSPPVLKAPLSLGRVRMTLFVGL